MFLMIDFETPDTDAGRKNKITAGMLCRFIPDVKKTADHSAVLL